MKKHLKTFVFLGLLTLLLFYGAPALGAQAFGFGDGAGTLEGAKTDGGASADAGAAAGASPAFSGPNLKGEVSFGLLAFPEKILDGDFSDSAALPAAALSLNAAGSKADARIALKLDEDLLSSRPENILDEAWLQLYTGQTIIQGGLMRHTWGRADSLSVLDILNPKDLSDLTLRDEQDRKIPQPMLRISQGLGSSLSAELVYLPWFEGDRLAMDGPWIPSQIKTLLSVPNLKFASLPDTYHFNFGQAGLRLNASLIGLDLGAQYFYGRLTTPYINTTDIFTFMYLDPSRKIGIGYNTYQQIGADAAFVLGGFNVRLEGGINLTEDSAGTDTLVYNRNIVWSAGFDRELFAGINLNFQSSGKVRLQHDKITSPLDIESGMEISSTQLAALLSRSFLRDTLKVEFLGLLGVEKQDYMIEPGLVLSVGDAEIALRGRYFGGDSEGEFGQFNDRSYVSLSSKYEF
jgi:hypothetical protein